MWEGLGEGNYLGFCHLLVSISIMKKIERIIVREGLILLGLVLLSYILYNFDIISPDFHLRHPFVWIYPFYLIVRFCIWAMRILKRIGLTDMTTIGIVLIIVGLFAIYFKYFGGKWGNFAYTGKDAVAAGLLSVILGLSCVIYDIYLVSKRKKLP